MDALTIRPALPEDALELLRWRNDPLVRAMSRGAQPIEEGDHLAWYTDVCRDPNRMLLIGYLGAMRIGMVRFDRCPPSAWETSMLLAPEARGRGLGAGLMSAALVRLESLGGPAVVLAEVRESNAAIIRLLESVGFRLTGSEPGFRRYRRPGAGTAPP